MNLTDAVVIEVVGQPYEKYGKWFVRVVCEAYGVRSETVIFKQSKEQAEEVKPGYQFLI